jgi:hypothetical protein
MWLKVKIFFGHFGLGLEFFEHFGLWLKHFLTIWLEVGVMYQYGPFDILHTAKEGHIFQECPCDQGINLGINCADT